MLTKEGQPVLIVQDAKEAEARIEVLDPQEPSEMEIKVRTPFENIDPDLISLTQGYTDF
jgi:hypothetical protein